MDCSLQMHPEGYRLSCLQRLAFPFVSTYALRHLDLAQKESSTCVRWGHRVIAAIQLIPIVGLFASLIERIIVLVRGCLISKTNFNNNSIQPAELSENSQKLLDVYVKGLEKQKIQNKKNINLRKNFRKSFFQIKNTNIPKNVYVRLRIAKKNKKKIRKTTDFRNAFSQIENTNIPKDASILTVIYNLSATALITAEKKDKNEHGHIYYGTSNDDSLTKFEKKWIVIKEGNRDLIQLSETMIKISA